MKQRSSKKKLRIVKYGHPALRQKSSEITLIDDSVRQFAAQLTEALQESDVPGVGLAAPQVGVNTRMVVIDTRPSDESPAVDLTPGEALLNPQMPIVLLNPSVVADGDELSTCGEGCLSVPGVSGDVTRPKNVILTATLLDGQQIQCQCGNLLARCLQHEIDHLNGVMFIDRAPEEQQKRATGTLRHLVKEEQKLAERQSLIEKQKNHA